MQHSTPDVLDQLLRGSHPITNVKKFLTASPESAPLVESYFNEKFYSQVTTNGKLVKGKYHSFMKQWEQRGLFEAFPHLKGKYEEILTLTEKQLQQELYSKEVRSFSY